MGQWAMTVHGHGIHDNGRDDDAEALLGRFVADLRAKGHLINSARFTVGTDRLITPDGALKDGDSA